MFNAVLTSDKFDVEVPPYLVTFFALYNVVVRLIYAVCIMSRTRQTVAVKHFRTLNDGSAKTIVCSSTYGLTQVNQIQITIECFGLKTGKWKVLITTSEKEMNENRLLDHELESVERVLIFASKKDKPPILIVFFITFGTRWFFFGFRTSMTPHHLPSSRTEGF